MRLEIKLSIAESLALHCAAMNAGVKLTANYVGNVEIASIEIVKEELPLWRRVKDDFWWLLYRTGMTRTKAKLLTARLYDVIEAADKPAESPRKQFLEQR